MTIKDFFKLSLKKPACIDGISEDSLRDLVSAIELEITDEDFNGFVRSTGGTVVKFNFDSDGNFSGVTAKINSKNVKLFNGVADKQLYIFKGPPTSTNPGAGWKTEVTLTRNYLNQPINENDWEIFYATREPILNNI